MATARNPVQGYLILAIGIFFLLVTTALYFLNRIKSSLLPMYLAVSAVLVVLGVLYAILTRKLSSGSRDKAPNRKGPKGAASSLPRKSSK